MLAHPDFKKKTIDNYKQERFMRFMLALCVFVTCSLTLVNVEVITKIQC